MSAIFVLFAQCRSVRCFFFLIKKVEISRAFTLDQLWPNWICTDIVHRECCVCCNISSRWDGHFCFWWISSSWRNVVQSEIFKLESGLLLSLALQTRTQIFLSEYERIGHVDRGSCLGLCYTWFHGRKLSVGWDSSGAQSAPSRCVAFDSIAFFSPSLCCSHLAIVVANYSTRPPWKVVQFHRARWLDWLQVKFSNLTKWKSAEWNVRKLLNDLLGAVVLDTPVCKWAAPLFASGARRQTGRFLKAIDWRTASSFQEIVYIFFRINGSFDRVGARFYWFGRKRRKICKKVWSNLNEMFQSIPRGHRQVLPSERIKCSTFTCRARA